MKMNYSYGIAAESTASLPSFNVLIHCSICPKTDPAIWKYFMRVHFEEKHKTFDPTRNKRLWKFSNFERSEMKKIWTRRGKVTMKCTKKSKIPGMYIVFFCPWNMKRVYFRIYFLSNDHEPRLSRFQSVEGEDKVTETEGINAEGGDFDEEDTEEVEIGEFWGGMEDLDSMASVGREEAGEDCEMWADLDSVQNSELEAVPIV